MKLGQQLAGGGRESATPEKAAGKVVCHLSPGDFVIPAQIQQSAPPELKQAVLGLFKQAGINPETYLVPQPKGKKGAEPQQPQQPAQQPQQAPQGMPQE